MQKSRSVGRDWTLGDGEVAHEQAPRRFFIPALEVRSALSVGDVVRLLFQYTGEDERGPDAERMWVEIIDRTGEEYIGTLTNQPQVIQDLVRGDSIQFAARHVIAVLSDGPDPYEKLVAFVNRRLLEDDALEPGFVVHEPEDRELHPSADGRQPSGWQLLVGDEIDAELEDPQNVLTPNLGWLLERYPVFGALVKSGASDGSWFLSADGQRYQPG